MRNRLRWPGITDVRFIGATNPGGAGHAWVKRMWLDRQFAEQETEANEFIYIRALAQDNPHIDKSYLKQLESLPNDKRRAYLEGDWDIFKGQFFHEFRREIHVCAPFEIPKEWRIVMGGDYGQTKPSAIYWAAISPDDQLFIFRELYKTGMTYSDVGKAIASMTEPQETIEYAAFDPSLWSKEPAASLPLTGAEIIMQSYKEQAKRSLNMIRGNHERIAGWGQVREYLKPFYKNEQLTSRLQIFSTCGELIRTLPSLVYSETRVEDCNSDGEDHAADSIRYLIMSRPTPRMTLEQQTTARFNAMVKKKQTLKGNSLRFVK